MQTQMEMENRLEIVNVNRVNKFLSGKFMGIGFSIKNGWLEIGGADFMDIESETRIRTEIRSAISKYFGLESAKVS